MIDVAAEIGRIGRGLADVEARAGSPVAAPDVSGWSVAEHLHHVALVAGSVATAVGAILHGRGEPGPPVGEAARAILETGTIPRGAGAAPEPMRPSGSPDAEEIRKAVAKARARWEKLSGRAEEIAAAAGRLPHHALGPLTAAEWVRFAAVHGDHHARIVAEIEATA